MKQVFTDLIRCLYSKMTAALGDKVLGALTGAIDIPGLVKEATDRATKGEDGDGYPSGATTNPYVPMCTAESITAQVLAGSRPEIESANNNLVDNLNSYLDDVTDTLAGISGILGDVKNLIPDISGSITSALSFTNIKLNVFGCEIEPNVAASDFYTFCQGGGSQSPAQLPSSKSVDDKTEKESKKEEGVPAVEGKSYLEPTGADRGKQPKTSAGSQAELNQINSGVA